MLVTRRRFGGEVEQEFADGIVRAWLSANEEELRRNSVLRDKNGVVALKLLPVFEEHPQGWNAVRQFPVSTARIGEYMEAWMASVPDVDRRCVESVHTALAHG